jgi:hypothetical protein
MSKIYGLRGPNTNANWTNQPFELVAIPDPNASGSPSNPFNSTTTVATLNALAATGPKEIWVANPAVPRLESRLWRNAEGTGYGPPRGELICQEIGKSAPLFASIVGVNSLLRVYRGPIIPDYMFPDGIAIDLKGHFGVRNAAGSAGVRLGACISGVEPTDTGGNSYPLGLQNSTPTTSGVGNVNQITGRQTRDGATFWGGQWCATEMNLSGLASQASRDVKGSAVFASGSMRFYLMAVTTHANDFAMLNSYEAWAA